MEEIQFCGNSKSFDICFNCQRCLFNPRNKESLDAIFVEGISYNRYIAPNFDYNTKTCKEFIEDNRLLGAITL